MRRLLIRLLVIILVGGIGFTAVWLWVKDKVEASVDQYIYSDASKVPQTEAALVLGAQVVPDYGPSVALADRLKAAIDLQRQEKVKKLLMSGDGRPGEYDEVTVMREYAENQSVSSDTILEDPEGYRTYDSCYRAKNSYHLSRLTVVTQKDHLLRAVYTCRSLGIEAYGLEASDFSGGVWNSAYLHYRIREAGALVLAWVEATLVHPNYYAAGKSDR